MQPSRSHGHGCRVMACRRAALLGSRCAQCSPSILVGSLTVRYAPPLLASLCLQTGEGSNVAGTAAAAPRCSSCWSLRCACRCGWCLEPTARRLRGWKHPQACTANWPSRWRSGAGPAGARLFMHGLAWLTCVLREAAACSSCCGSSAAATETLACSATVQL